MDSVLALLMLVAAWIGGGDDPACLVLSGLDAARAKAFESGDVQRLGEAYADERAARPDAEVLRSYRDRGLQLRGVRLEQRECRAVSRETDRVVLDVVDRLAPTSVRSTDGPWRALPGDGWSRHTVELRRVGDVWRIGSVSVPRSSRR